MKDCIILGGGPAGLTAALYLARFLRSVTVFDAQEGRARMIPETHNLTPFPGGISGRDLLDRMRSHAGHHGAEIETGTVVSVEAQGDVFRVTTDRRAETARTVIFASGVVNHRPPLSVSDHDRGVALGLIRYCPVCDAYEIRDRRIAVLGSGTHGFREARFLRHYSASVTLIPPDGSAAVARDGVGVPGAPMAGLSLTESQVVVTLENGEALGFDTLYVALGTTPRTALAASLGVRLGTGGHVLVDARQKTGIDRVYAIGDVTDGLDQIAVAMGQAAVAATAIHNTLPARLKSERSQMPL
ncbi:NAD(P)/FAD-dependent oxidoreductase [Paracoccaceae bacterium Fryx2]|nr:NAD(P)/FAD-dependent oxidoreductase [Paracoccaceae bacterium Fryx2]